MNRRPFSIQPRSEISASEEDITKASANTNTRNSVATSKLNRISNLFVDTNGKKNNRLSLLAQDIAPLKTNASKSGVDSEPLTTVNETNPNSFSHLSNVLSPTMEDTEYRTTMNQNTNSFTRILPNLIIGSEKESKDYAFLKSNGITHILNVARECKNSFIHLPDFTYHHCSLDDRFDQEIKPVFPETYAFLENALQKKGNVYLHCSFGISRSPAILIAYLMRKNSWTMKDAYQFVKDKREVICPNFGFICQLTEYEKELAINNPNAVLRNPDEASSAELLSALHLEDNGYEDVFNVDDLYNRPPLSAAPSTELLNEKINSRNPEAINEAFDVMIKSLDKKISAVDRTNTKPEENQRGFKSPSSAISQGSNTQRTKTSSDVANLRLLVLCDPKSMFYRSLVKIISIAGHVFVNSFSIEEAYTLVQSQVFDAIVIDLTLPIK